MTQEEKQLSLKDICARLPYGVKIQVSCLNKPLPVWGVDEQGVNGFKIEVVKPYLRPMSSMTEDEKREYHEIDGRAYTCPEEYAHVPAADRIDWLNVHHLDFRGLISTGLALEAPEDMYKTE